MAFKIANMKNEFFWIYSKGGKPNNINLAQVLDLDAMGVVVKGYDCVPGLSNVDGKYSVHINKNPKHVFLPMFTVHSLTQVTNEEREAIIKALKAIENMEVHNADPKNTRNTKVPTNNPDS